MNLPSRRRWRPVDGVLLLDKPAGMSSNAALQAARRLFSAAKAGHTGTLDPMAEGLLPLTFGEATKFAGDLLNADKAYVATLKLGERTTTGDAEGEVVQTRPVSVTAEAIESALASFRGLIRQVPPMYSALKRDGKPLYAYARAGETVAREAREITVHHLTCSYFDNEMAVIEVVCSKGTYVRVLAEDIGEALECGAHLSALRRTRVGKLSIDEAVTLDSLEACDEASRDALLAPVDRLIQELPRIDLDAEAERCFVHGQPVRLAGCEAALPDDCTEGRSRVYGEGGLVGVGIHTAEGLLKPKRLVVSRAVESE